MANGDQSKIMADLEILGQKLKFPLNGWLALVVGIIASGLVLAVFIRTRRETDMRQAHKRMAYVAMMPESWLP